MNDTQAKEGLCSRLLNSADETWKLAKWCVILGAIFEAFLWITFLVLMDFGDRFHWLLLVLAAMIYCPLACWVIAAGFYARNAALQVRDQLERFVPAGESGDRSHST